VLRDGSGGCGVSWPGGVRRRGGVSAVCGFRVEREKACRDTVPALLPGREGEPVKSQVLRRGVRVPWRGALADRLVVVVKAW
jgi:hypothetical protein